MKTVQELEVEAIDELREEKEDRVKEILKQLICNKEEAIKRLNETTERLENVYKMSVDEIVKENWGKITG